MSDGSVIPEHLVRFNIFIFKAWFKCGALHVYALFVSLMIIDIIE